MTKRQALEEIKKTRNPSTKHFEILGLPFEAFLRFSGCSKDKQEKLIDMLIRPLLTREA